jgi:hypothetical protein
MYGLNNSSHQRREELGEMVAELVVELFNNIYLFVVYIILL